jgi:hypothetical protein
MRRLPTRPMTPTVELGLERVEPPSPAPLAPPASGTEPLAPERYKVQFTASRDLRDKLERLQAPMQEDLVRYGRRYEFCSRKESGVRRQESEVRSPSPQPSPPYQGRGRRAIVTPEF